MDRVSVRLLVTRDGIETSIEESVHSENILSELNERIFPDVPASAKIKWIYRGRQLKDKLPPSIQPATAFHVYVFILLSITTDSKIYSGTVCGSAYLRESFI